jgi:signal transduction histidine kinase
VIDEGEGIPPELLPRIFELYFTTKPTGSGIGLAMTYRILQMHGGALEVRSSTGHDSDTVVQGTTFTLRLPVTLSAAVAEMREMERTGSARVELERRA